MSATAVQSQLEIYVREQAVSALLSVFEYADPDQLEELAEALGLPMHMVTNMVGTPLWTEFNPEETPTPEVEYADARAAMLGARLCRLLVDEPDLLRSRAAHLEAWAAGVFSRHAPTTEAGAS